MSKVKQIVGGAKRLTARKTNSPKRYRISSIQVTEEAYKKDSSKYGKFPKVLIARQNGVVFDLQDYKKLQTIQLPCSNFAKTIVQENKIPQREITEGDITNSNRVDMVQWSTWWDEAKLVKNGSFITLKDHPNCYVVSEGIFNIDTLELAVPFIALQKSYGFNILQTYYVLDAFLKHADLEAVRDYTFLSYGVGEMPSVAPDSLNYIKDDNILGVKNIGYATLYSILSDHFHISKDIIYEWVQKELIVVDSKYNIVFLSYEDGNVVSAYKVSRYKHQEDKFSYNLYVTKPNVSFTYCSDEAKQQDTFTSLTVFGNPIEMLCYFTLASSSYGLVPPLDDSGCYMAMVSGKVGFVKEWLTKHAEVGNLNIALHFNRGHQYNTRAIIRDALELKIPRVNELRNLISNYAMKAVMKPHHKKYQLSGWSDLINLRLDKLNASFVPLSKFEINRYKLK